jgi:metal-responsive CopG/Arc/MetJ family transcriptional regulator
MIAVEGFTMAEKQVLFRIEGKLLDNLDKRIAKEGYSTRNAWFKEVVSGYAKGAAAKAKKGRK